MRSSRSLAGSGAVPNGAGRRWYASTSEPYDCVVIGGGELLQVNIYL